MAVNAPVLYLVCYDIADPRRLVRVHRYLKEHAVPVQYSVFVTRMRAKALDALMAGLAEIIDPRTDDVRAYPLPKKIEVEKYGRDYFPGGVFLLQEDRDLLSLAQAA